MKTKKIIRQIDIWLFGGYAFILRLLTVNLLNILIGVLVSVIINLATGEPWTEQTYMVMGIYALGILALAVLATFRGETQVIYEKKTSTKSEPRPDVSIPSRFAVWTSSVSNSRRKTAAMAACMLLGFLSIYQGAFMLGELDTRKHKEAAAARLQTAEFTKSMNELGTQISAEKATLLRLERKMDSLR